MSVGGGLGPNPLAADLSEAEMISVLVKGHNPVLTILQQRVKHVQMINAAWNSKDTKVSFNTSVLNYPF
jgi:hypothetical protein